MSSESIASPPARAGATESCASCGAPLAGDQRYCLECGERRAPISSVLLGGAAPASAPDAAGVSQAAPAGVTPAPGAPPPFVTDAPRSNAVTVIAGVGVLLLAMGVGVLIGRSGGAVKQSAAPQVISVATAPAGGGASAGGAQAASFTDDWPAGTNGYTVQLQTLAQSTQASAVEAAKAAAGAKGAKHVGALKSEDFASLTAGHYVIYSGVFHRKAEAEKALVGLKKSFAGASVIKVASGGASSGAGGSGAAGGGSGASSGASHPAPPKAAEELTKSHGKSYEEKSKNLPNQVET